MILIPWKKLFFTYICPHFWGGGGGPTQTYSQVQQNTMPDWLRPQSEALMGAATQQMFYTDGNQITGLKPYKPYSTNPADYVAPFSPLQQQAQTEAKNLQMPGQFKPATQLATGAGLGALGSANTALGYGAAGQAEGGKYAKQAQNPNAVNRFMNPYVQASLAPQLQVMQQQEALQEAQNRGNAAAAGAYGGNRMTLQQGLTQQNNALAQQQAIGQGYNTAYQQAQQAMQEAGRQRLAGTSLGLQGVQQAQAGYGLGIQAAGQLGGLGTAQLQAQQGIIGTQMTAGQQQTARQQAMIDAARQEYYNSQQWPRQQLSDYSAYLHGFNPNTYTQNYQTPPSTASQIGGLALNAVGQIGSAYASQPGRKKGGLIKKRKGSDLADLMIHKIMTGGKK